MTTDGFQSVMPLSELPVGRMQAHTIAGREIVVCNTREGVFALDNICTHAYARMNEGRLRGTKLICPMHGACFDVRTGRVLAAPAVVQLAIHETRITNGTIEVAISATAPKPLSPE